MRTITWLALLGLMACSEAGKPAASGEVGQKTGALTGPGTAPAQAPVAVPVQAPAPVPVVVAELPWGPGPRHAGRVLEGEQNPEAPMSLDADAQGRVWLLDQVNERALRFDGRDVPSAQIHSIPVSRTAQDLAVEADGRLLVLDRLVSREVRRLDPQTGQVLAAWPVQGSNVPEAGLVTGLFAHDGGVWVEVEHGPLVRLDHPDRPMLAGRPTADGRWHLRALRVPPDGNSREVGKAVVAGKAPKAREDEAPGLAREASFPLPVAALAGLDGDGAGRVWLTADLVRLGPDDLPVEAQRQAVAWDADGREVARLQLCAPTGPEEQLRTVRLGRDGALYAMCRGQTGLKIEKAARQPDIGVGVAP